MYFTDKEYMLLLSALDREKKVCEKVENECCDYFNLSDTIDDIEEKIRNIQHAKVGVIEWT